MARPNSILIERKRSDRLIALLGAPGQGVYAKTRVWNDNHTLLTNHLDEKPNVLNREQLKSLHYILTYSVPAAGLRAANLWHEHRAEALRWTETAIDETEAHDGSTVRAEDSRPRNNEQRYW